MKKKKLFAGFTDFVSPCEWRGTDRITLAVNNIDWPITNIGSMVAQLLPWIPNRKQTLGLDLAN